MTRRRYPSDLSEAEGARLAPLVPAARDRERHQFLAAWPGGLAWRALPHDFPPCKTLSHDWRAGRLSGDWERIHARVREPLRAGRAATPSAGIVASQRVKTPARGGRPAHPGTTAASQ
jgi:putative transposase